jgi:anaerobic selenocysteine-containing dehydrogenase
MAIRARPMHGRRFGKGRTSIGSAVLVAGGILCGVPSAPLPAAATGAEATLRAPKVERTPCPASPTGCALMVAQAPAGDTPVNIISDQIRRQGYACDEPRQAERDREASRPNLTVWIMRCGNASYRVTLIPDLAARVERLP